MCKVERRVKHDGDWNRRRLGLSIEPAYFTVVGVVLRRSRGLFADRWVRVMATVIDFRPALIRRLLGNAVMVQPVPGHQ